MTILEGKVALVTGASSGIGRAIAVQFASAGAKIVAGARRREALDDLVAEIGAQGGAAEAVAGDVTDEGFAAALVGRAVDAFGGLDIAINNAGMLGRLAPTQELTAADWRATLDVNLTGAFLGARHQVPAMPVHGGGSLIFVSSFVGYTVGMPGMAAYAASKAGMIGLTKVLAAELGPQGIRVNALLPGGTDTAAGREVANTPEALAFVEGLHALKRIAKPEEIARAALFLASDDSSFMTGSAMLVEGGVSITRA